MQNTREPLKEIKKDNLFVQIYNTREELGRAVAIDVAEKMKELLSKKDYIRMIFASAPSQLDFFKTIREISGIDWSRVIAFQMDEYIGLEPDHPQRFSQYLNDHLFKYVKPGTVDLIDSFNDETKERARYTHSITDHPIDIVCLGIGENGHIAFNDPPDARFDEREIVKKVKLDELSRQQQVNDGCFSKIADVPTHALTLTIPALMGGNHLYCVVPDALKQDAVEKTLNGPITSEVPASILRQHFDCTLYLDLESSGGLAYE